MAESYKILGHYNPSDTSEYILYTAPAFNDVIVTSLVVVNRAITPKTFTVRALGAISTYLYYNAPIDAESYVTLEPGVALNDSQTIYIKGDNEMMFSIYGVEIGP